MARSEETLDVYTCDGCGRRFVETETMTPPPGYYGTVNQVAELPGDDRGEFEWFAHQRSCIRAAILKVTHA